MLESTSNKLVKCITSAAKTRGRKYKQSQLSRNSEDSHHTLVKVMVKKLQEVGEWYNRNNNMQFQNNFPSDLVYRQKRLNKIEEDWRNDGGRAQKEYKKHLQFVREKRIIYFDLETTEKDHKFHPLTLNNTLDMQTLHKNKNIVLFPNM